VNLRLVGDEGEARFVEVDEGDADGFKLSPDAV
jgi:hypothetical protein